MSNLSAARELQLTQLDEALHQWRHTDLARPPASGWARAIRVALGMPLRALAVRMGLTEGGVRKLEIGEAEGTTSLATLQKLADALDCDLQYALVPRKPLEQMLMDKARLVAAAELAPVSHSMRLEAQEVGAQQSQAQLEAWARYILANRPRRELW